METETKTTETVYKTVTPENLHELVADLRAATEAGQAAMGDDDGGTCNFDAPGLLCASKAERRLATAAVKCAGGTEFKWRKYGLVLGFGRGLGQGFTRTRFAEAFRKCLEAKGWNATVYYQMD